MPAEPSNPFDVTPFVNDMRCGRALFLIIDNQKSAFQGKDEFGNNFLDLIPTMARYHDVLPKFCTLVEDHITNIHIAFAFNSPQKYRNAKDPKWFDENRLMILKSLCDEEYEECDDFMIDFLQRYDPMTDMYVVKNCMSALNDGVLEKIILSGKYGSVFIAGIAAGACVKETAGDLVKLKERSPHLENIAIVTDLTNNSSCSKWETGADMMKQHLVIREKQGDHKDQISYLHSQQIIDALYPQLDIDLDMPLNYNMQIIGRHIVFNPVKQYVRTPF